MAIELESKLVNQLYKEQLAKEGKTVKAFEEEILQEALGKLFDRTSSEFKLFKSAILDYHKQEKVNQMVHEKVSNPSENMPEVKTLAPQPTTSAPEESDY